MLNDLRASKRFAVAVVFLGVFADLTVYSVIIPIIPFILIEIGESQAWIGGLLAFFGIGVIVGSIGFGYAVTKSKISKRIGMTAALVVVWAAIILFALSKSVWMLVLARLLQGIASSGVFVLGLAYIADIYDSDPSSLGVVMSFIFSGIALGNLVGPPIGGALYDIGHLYPFIFCAALVAVDFLGRISIIDQQFESAAENVAVTSAITEPSTAVEVIPVPSASSECASAELAITVVDKQESPTPPTAELKAPATAEQDEFSLRALLKMRQLLVVSALCFLVSLLLTQVEPTVPLYLIATYGYNSAEIGALFLVFVLPNIAGTMLGGFLFDRLGLRAVSLVGLPTVVLSLVVLALPQPVHIVWTCFTFVVFGFFIGFATAPVPTGIAAAVPKQYYTLGYVLMNIVNSLGIAVGPVIGSLVYNSYGWMWQQLAFAFLAILGLPLLFLMPKK